MSRQSRPQLCRSGRAFSLHAGDRGSVPDRDRPKLLKQVVIVPLPNGNKCESHGSSEMKNNAGWCFGVTCFKQPFVGNDYISK